MIESKTSRWIAETHAVLSGSNKIMLTLRDGPLEPHYYMPISIEIHCTSTV